MRSHTLKIVAVVVGVGGLVVFAAWRVRPYLHDPYAGERAQRQAKVRLIENSVIPEYDNAIVDANVELYDSLDRKIRAVFRSFPEADRPSTADEAAIRERYLGFVALNLTGTRQDLLDQYSDRGYKPYTWLVQQEDPTKPDKAWQASVAWARYAPFDIDSLRIETVYRKGRRVTPPRYIAAPVLSPNIDSGTLYALLSKPDRAHTAYEFLTTHTVPNKDGKSEFPVTVCVMIANTGPRGSWDVVATTHTEIPEGTLFSLPHP